jgi:hypothetical protein
MIWPTGRRKGRVKAVSDEPNPKWTKTIKDAYLASTINFATAVYKLRVLEHTPYQAQKLVYEWIKEKHNNVPRDK